MPSITLNWKAVEKAEDFDFPDVTKYLTSNGGVYLWIIGTITKRVCYVGKADIFWKRFVEHFTNTIAGRYICYYPDEHTDFVDYLHDNYADKDYFDLLQTNDKIYLPTVQRPDIFSSSVKNTFLDNLSVNKRIEFLKSLQFAFATIASDSTTSSISYEHVESAIILELKKQYESKNEIRLKKGGRFSGFDRGGYIGRISKRPTSSFDIIHTNDPASPRIIPPEVFNIKRYDR
jgi:hypothetical protein